MDDVAKWDKADREELFAETAGRIGIANEVIEKDFWVCWTLKKLFSAEDQKNNLMFKGGTTLSKVFKVIQRFSEDIDLVLRSEVITKEDIMADRSRKKQRRFNDALRELTTQYLEKILLPRLQDLIEPVCVAQIDEDDAQKIKVGYPASFDSEYLRPEVLLEIGPISAWRPNRDYEFSPYAAEEFPDQFSSPTCTVPIIEAERTFWEKATILHHEANRPEGSLCPTRYSRHYYDLALMADSPIKEKALADLELLKEVVEFKDKHYYRGWAKYHEAKPGTFKLVPPDRIRTALERDYRDMMVMIFGDVPKFDWIMKTVENLESEINEL